MTDDCGDYTAQLPASDLEALCSRIASCAVKMDPYEQLAVMQSFGMNPDSPEDMQILYAGVQIALSRVPREKKTSRSPSPDRDFGRSHLNVPKDVDVHDLAEPTLQARRICIPHKRITSFGTKQLPDSTDGDLALHDIQVSLGKMQISQKLASKRGGMCDSLHDERSSRAAPYVHKTIKSATKMAKRYSLDRNSSGPHDAKDFIGQKQRNPDDLLVCLWDRATCKAVIPSGRDEDIFEHLAHHHGFVISGAPVLKKMCQWGEKCHIYVHDADMVNHIARKGRGEDHCRFDEYRCKLCFKFFSNIDKLVGHVVKSHKAVALH
ncbi:hypothetical protein D9619_012886 [Psilocybe cf. subviscida]|uniref:C2H2-type domain-containing protein n=1 Tax=Psilocybe cf. subviscida TaxID=2480587 RepID=A0A8H5BK90_9AGAR|nr:hypothetical protein D9619_012886 [Psilocybe cf. subviscida]